MSYVSNISQFGDPDVVIIPGSKNTISDLLWMRQNGLEGKILRHAAKGGIVFGICGGYQMLGQSISDPTGAEQKGTVRGMGLLPVTTVFEQEKRRTRVSGRFAKVGGALAEMSGENGFVQGDCSACLYGRGRRTAAGRSAERSCIWLLYAWDFRYV